MVNIAGFIYYLFCGLYRILGILQAVLPVCQPQPPNGGYDENIFIVTPPDSLKCPVVVRDPYLLLSCAKYRSRGFTLMLQPSIINYIF